MRNPLANRGRQLFHQRRFQRLQLLSYQRQPFAFPTQPCLQFRRQGPPIMALRLASFQPPRKFVVHPIPAPHRAQQFAHPVTVLLNFLLQFPAVAD